MIDLAFLENEQIAVLGLGKSGLSTVRALAAANAKIVAWDDNEPTRAKASESGAEIADLAQIPLDGFRYFILSPGIPHTYPAPHPAVENARRYQVPIIGDIDLLAQAEQSHTISITGTNGKSTTTALIGHILQQHKKEICIGGNLGTPVLDFDPAPTYVLELSSYQLELAPNLHCDTAIFLNISADQLERHGGMDGYIAAKENIFQGTGIAIIGQDDEHTKHVTEKLQAANTRKIIPISSAARQPQGISVLNGILHDDINNLTFDISAIPTLPGAHNGQNAAAAYAACLQENLSGDQIVQAMQNYPGLPHRQQRIATVNNVRFINDSKGTNADAAGKALACYQNIYWIIGGRAKETGLDGLEIFAPVIRHAFIIGEASDRFAAWCQAQNIPYTQCGILDRAVAEAAQLAFQENKSDAVVLLSPACASWDQYQSYEHRGAHFAELVNQVKEKA